MASLAQSTVYLVSDVHWRPAEPEAPPELGAFGAFLDDLAAQSQNQESILLFVLGDLFDFWIERPGRIWPGFAAHLDCLARATSAGVEICLLSGNRDFACGPELRARTGIRLAGDHLTLKIDPLRIYLEHGDLLCTRDHRYQLYRRVIRSWPVALALRILPWWLLTGLVRWLRRTSRAEIRRKPAAVMEIDATMVQQRFIAGHTHLVCGHVHRPTLQSLGAGPRAGQLCVLGPWDQQKGWFVTVRKQSLQLTAYTGPADSPTDPDRSRDGA